MILHEPLNGVDLEATFKMVNILKCSMKPMTLKTWVNIHVLKPLTVFIILHTV